MNQNKWLPLTVASAAIVFSLLLFWAALRLIQQRITLPAAANADSTASYGTEPVSAQEESASSEPYEFAIIKQPRSSTVPNGSELTVTVKAVGQGLHYQWYFRKKTQAVFSEWVGHTHAAETVTPNDSWDGIQLYCTVGDSFGNLTESDTVTVTIDRRTRVLAVGDSICRGYRNGEKGFVGDLDVCFLNLGVSGSTLSTARSDVDNIPAQLRNARNFIPDIVIADGGYNDYIQEAPLGEIPAVPAGSSEEPEDDTVMGGLQRLFLIMEEKYPDAQKFFLITHRVCRQGVYLVTAQNIQGYTQQDLHDAILQCCEVYGVSVIDVFNDSPLDTYYDDYRSAENYTWLSDPGWVNARSNVTDYVDSDGVHPLTRGYLECYVPLVKRAFGM